MNIKFKFVICVLLLFFPVKGFAETIYDQPYLGEFPDFFRERFSALALKQKVATNLATIVQQSDLIILAETEKISEALESSDRIIIYDANVKILKTFKNKPTNTFLHLEFKASATSIENNSKHIFFLKQMKDGYQVLKASYIFPRGQGYDNFMRIFGAYDCSENVGTDVINYLATLRLPVNIEENLINEYLSEDWGKMYSAVHMASATAPVTGNSVLKMAVSVKERKRFDIDLYGTAAYSLAVQKRQDNWRVILENITHDPLRLSIDDKNLFIDLGAERIIAAIKGEQKIAVEIKSFVGRSEVDDLENAVGQFVLYQDLLEEEEPERELFLAIRRKAFDGIFSHRIGDILLRKKRINLLVFDEKDEEIVQWIS